MDQIAIACAFCTAGGVQLLLKHVPRLKNDGSFVVISARNPTNFEALAELHTAIPGHLFVHFGGQKPEEYDGWPPLMHSKTFYARKGSKCWVWTGSHNLTASAILGINCEAAILLEGHSDEEPMAAALDHLLACRNEARPFDPDMHGHPDPSVLAQSTVIIHAECMVAIASPPWHIQLRVSHTNLDEVLAMPSQVRLYLYDPGTLANGWQNSQPVACFAGATTGLNFTDLHPEAGGIIADWERANFVIDEVKGVPRMALPAALPIGTLTQSVYRIDQQWTVDEVWLTEKPKSKLVNEVAPETLVSVDEDMYKFFKPSSRRGHDLISQTIIGRRPAVEVPKDDVRIGTFEKLRVKVQNFTTAEVELIAKPSKQQHPYIYRRKYRL